MLSYCVLPILISFTVEFVTAPNVTNPATKIKTRLKALAFKLRFINLDILNLEKQKGETKGIWVWLR